MSIRPRRHGAIALLLTVFWSLTVPPGALGNSYPGWANSHYMSPVSQAYMYDRGCDLADGLYQQGSTNNQAVILDFGGAAISGGSQGASLWSGGGHQFESTSWVAGRIEQFGLGWYHCSSASPFLTVIAGIHTDTGNLTASHATAWANMVDDINTWMASQGISWQVLTMGGIDIESGFAATQTEVTDWVDAYSAAGGAFVYDFGDAAGCPTNAQYTASPGYQCNRSWSQNKYWYWSHGCAACGALPEIYNQTVVTLGNGNASDPNAQQWEGIRRYGYWEKGSDPIYLSGSVTQHTACAQPGHSCPGVNNTATTGWTHLHNSMGYYTPIETFLAWSTDFMWGW